MADSGALLRLLEPAVRPGQPASSQRGSTDGVAPQGADFEQMLSRARATNEPQAQSANHQATAANDGTSAQTNDTTDAATVQPTLSPLEGVDRIENPALRQLRASAQANKPDASASSDS
jgi:flagellar hook-basal body complex protein FliE